ncbi:MAG TPA: hypothetical protein VNW23_03950 [Opitutaceae bacterium]|jgi:hypothetical protein|nr:hypothetical protein [Opitutaceae bacterium]
MSFTEFQQSLRAQEGPPAGLPPALQALWHDAKGDWERAHSTVQQETSRDGAWVHAYLHRKEGDEGNAGYWYARAGRPFPETSLEAEWTEIAGDLLLKTANER